MLAHCEQKRIRTRCSPGNLQVTVSHQGARSSLGRGSYHVRPSGPTQAPSAGGESWADARVALCFLLFLHIPGSRHLPGFAFALPRWARRPLCPSLEVLPRPLVGLQDHVRGTCFGHFRMKSETERRQDGRKGKGGREERCLFLSQLAEGHARRERKSGAPPTGRVLS